MSTLTSLPHDTEAELALISLVLLNREASSAFEKLRPDDFYEIVHQQIWTAMLSLYGKGNAIDVITLSNALKEQAIDSTAARKQILECFEFPTVGFANIDRFIGTVKNSSVLRKLLFSLEAQKEKALEQGASAKDVVAEVEKDMIVISEEQVDAVPHDLPSIVDEVDADIQTVRKYGWKGISTGFLALDNRTGGLIPSHVWIVGAYTGTGKTFFLLQMVLNILENGGSVMLFSTEMDRKMNVLRMLANLASLGTIQVMRADMDETQAEAVKQAQEKLKSYGDRLTIYDNVYTVAEMRLKAKKKKLSGGLDVVVVDFIQNLKGAEDIFTRMSQAAIELQQLANELKVCTVIASQVSQTAASWKSKEVIEYKGAGEIAAVADVGLWIRKSQDMKDSMDGASKVFFRELILRKVRHGAPALIHIKMEFPSGRVTQLGGTQQKDDDDDTLKGFES